MQYSIRLYWLLAFLFSTGLAVAQKAAPATLDAPLEKSLLWEIKGKGIKTSYLYGTIHLISSQDYFLMPAAEKKFQKAKRLVLEIDISNPMAMGLEMMVLAPMKENKRLKDLYSPEDYAVVKKYFTEESKNTQIKSMPFDMLETWKPMLIQSVLYQDGIDLKGGSTKSYEMELVSMAQKRKMSFGGLETIGDQMSIFDKIPYEKQAEALLESIQELKTSNGTSALTELESIVQLYKTQDIEGMITMTDEEYGDIEGADDLLLNNRNQNWIDKIVQYAQKEPIFFAVGAAHLAGDNGVIKLLIKKGYTLTPIR